MKKQQYIYVARGKGFYKWQCSISNYPIIITDGDSVRGLTPRQQIKLNIKNYYCADIDKNIYPIEEGKQVRIPISVDKAKVVE